MKQYYIFVDDEQLGPLSLDEISSKKISKETKVWFEGLDDWKNAGEIEELSKFLISTPPPINSFTSQISPPKLVQKENFQVNSDVHENQKILGLNKNVFYWVLGVLVLIIGIVYFNNLQENNKAILLEQNRQTETYNQQQKEIEEQKPVTHYISEILKKYVTLSEVEESETYNHISGNIKHLRTDFTAKIEDNRLEELIEELHPTPAVCGIPKEFCKEKIIEIEQYNREFYAGYIKIETEEEIYYFVNLRCAKIYKNQVIAFAGGGITALSSPEKEWRETELKSQAILHHLQ